MDYIVIIVLILGLGCYIYLTIDTQRLGPEYTQFKETERIIDIGTIIVLTLALLFEISKLISN